MTDLIKMPALDVKALKTLEIGDLYGERTVLESDSWVLVFLPGREIGGGIFCRRGPAGVQYVGLYGYTNPAEEAKAEAQLESGLGNGDLQWQDSLTDVLEGFFC